MTTRSVPFAVKGNKSEWQMIYDDLLAGADFGAIITTEELDRVLGRSFKRSRQPIYRAREHLGETRQRWLSAVPGVGYRVIEANEHLTVAQGHKRRAKRQLGAMVKVAEVTDLSKLTRDELLAFDSQSRVNALLYAVAVHHEKRIAKIETVLRKEGML